MGVEEQEAGIPHRIQLLLEEYSHVFDEPTSLPPIRGREHVINLVMGTNPISMRPYMYPHCRKEEMEKLVKQMLDSRVISVIGKEEG